MTVEFCGFGSVGDSLYVLVLVELGSEQGGRHGCRFVRRDRARRS